MLNKQYFLQRLLYCYWGLPLCWMACGHRPSATIGISHLASVSRVRETLCIDRVDNGVIMKTAPAAGSETSFAADSKTSFCSFRVGWQDSVLLADQGQVMKKEKYFQYDMQKDWIALVKGDSLYPVFFQESPGLNRQLKEGVMVFEVPAGQSPDTLIYKDSFGGWGTQLFVLNRKQL